MLECQLKMIENSSPPIKVRENITAALGKPARKNAPAPISDNMMAMMNIRCSIFAPPNNNTGMTAHTQTQKQVAVINGSLSLYCFFSFVCIPVFELGVRMAKLTMIRKLRNQKIDVRN